MTKKEKLSEKIEKEILLSYDEQLSIFDLSPQEAKEFLLKYIRYGSICPNLQLKILSLPVKIAREIWNQYTRQHTFIYGPAKTKAKYIGWM